MIEVKWEFQGIDQGRRVQSAVEKIVRRLQRGFGVIICPDHKRSPRLRVGGTSLSTLDIGFETCCQRLTDETTTRVRDIRRRGKTEALTRAEQHRAAVDQHYSLRQTS